MKSKSVLKKMLSYIGKYKYFLFLSIIIAIPIVVLTLYVPILVGNAIDFVVGPGNVDFNSIIKVLIKIAIVVGVTAVLQWLMNVCNNKVAYNVVRDVRMRAFNKIEVLKFSYLDKNSHGDIVSRVISDIDQLSDGLLMGFSQLFTGVITIIGTLAFMLYINVWITLVVVVVTPLSFFIARFIAKKTYSMFKLQSETRGEQTAFIDEAITNEKIIKAYSCDEEYKNRFDDINDRLTDCSLKAIFFSSITNPATRFVNSIVYAAVALFGAILAVKGNITVGILVSVLAYANQYTKPFNEISSVITELQNAFACAKRIIDLIEEDEIENDKDGVTSLTSVKGHIELNNVDFSYVQDKKLIENLNLDIKPGMTVAIVGPTGCGKTTLINLLMRFYDVSKGEIRLDGINIEDIDRKSYRKNFGMVLQDTWLKSGTIAENIKMGKSDATDDEVIAAAKKSHAHSFIKRLPNGYNTHIAEDGGNLSIGQKQLLCITRIMLLEPSVLILDEATSSIDTTTEMRIQRAFKKLIGGKTSFIVAHRLSTIVSSDLILVMNNGNIVEKGTHSQLLKAKGFYYDLYNSQFPKAN